jgi:cytochrome c oxidase cbb3-type subunit III
MTRALALTIVLALAACESGAGTPPEVAAASARIDSIQMGELQPGVFVPRPSRPGPYADDARAVAEGKRLFGWFGCSGCHANGGGGMGPPLMDAAWIYGSEPENIFATIVQGRPNGMPSYLGRIPDYQVWELVAYVRSLSGNVPGHVAPGRADTAPFVEPEARREREVPRPGPAEHP